MRWNPACLRARMAISAVVLVILMGVLTSGPAVSQQKQQGSALPVPRIFIVTPSGGKAGSTLEVTVAGQDIDDPEELLFSQAGIRAEPIAAEPEPPAPPMPASSKKKGAPKAAPTTARKFKVAIPAETPPGSYDVRLVNRFGISNPRAFVVSALAEAVEKEPNNDVPQAQRVDMNSAVSGAVSSPTDVDYFVFPGHKGDHVVVSCLAASIDSRLQPAMQLYDGERRLLAFNHSYAKGDALLDCVLPGDGDYYLRLFGFTYTQGSAEHFYRVSISTTPWIDAVFPPLVEPGKPAQLTVHGRNLPGGKPDLSAVFEGRALEKLTVTVTPPNDPLAFQRLAVSGAAPNASALDGFEYRLKNATGSSNPFPIYFAQAPVVLDNETNDSPETAQEVSPPCEIAGRIEKKRDRDWYAFKAKKGQVFSIEPYGDRLGSALDLYYVLRNADSKKVLGEFDDNPDILKPGQFFTRTDDPPRQRFVAPEDGMYQLMVSSRESGIQAGPRDVYRMRITPEQPDFRLVIMPPSATSPDACVVGQSSHQFFTVLIWRLDGFNGEIALTAEGLPSGVTCQPQTVGADARQAILIVSAAENAPVWTGSFTVKGTATINGQTLVREARPATITWPVAQANIPAVSRLDRGLVLAVRDKPPFLLAAGIDSTSVIAGDKLTVPVKLTRLAPDLKAPLQITAMNLPANFTLSTGNNQPVAIPPDKDEGNVVFDVKANVAPGMYTIVLLGQTQVPFSKDLEGKQKTNINVVQPSLPILVTVLPKQLASFAVTPSNPTLKVGTPTELIVKVARTGNFAGEIKIQLVVPAETKGIQAEEATIPAGKDEAKLMLLATTEAAPGKNANLAIQAVARIKGNAQTLQTSKLSVTVEK